MSATPVSFEKYLTDRFVTRERYDAMPPADQGTWLTRYDAYIALMSSASASPGGIKHALPLPPSGATRKLVINAKISNKKTEASIDVLMHVDGGCEAFELVLLQEDVVALGIAATGEIVSGVQQDGSLLQLPEYERVFVELQHLDGSVESATLIPVAQAQPVEEVLVAGDHTIPAEVLPTHRLLGYGGLTRFGLKQDFVGHKLVHFIMRA